MTHDYSVSIRKISYYDLDYKEMSVCLEYKTWEEAQESYAKHVASESAHASTLNSVRTDIVVTMARKNSIQYRVRIAN